MNGEVKILIVEDTPTDAELCEYEIRKELKNCVFQRVETEEEFKLALKEFKPDLILSDFWLPRFTAMEALKIAISYDSGLPFIVVTGSINEETAVACIKAGAWDYVIKEHIKRLGQAVRGALEQKEIRRERKKVEEERNRLIEAINQAGEIIFITDRDGRILYVNSAVEGITGYHQEEVLGQNPRIFKSGHHPIDFYQDLWGTILSGQTWRGRIVNRRKDGSLYTEEATISPIRGEDGNVNYFIAVKRDVTAFLALQEEKEALQSQFIQAQKLESLGRLAGGIAHDFNNMLGVILGHAQIAFQEAEEGSIRHHIQEIIKAAERSADLTRQLLTFARRQPVSLKVVNVNEVVEETISMLKRLIPENIALEWELAEDLWPVKADATQISRLIVNLVTNARDAILDTGHIRIRTFNRRVDKELSDVRPYFRTGSYVVIEVSDDGVGMDEGTLAFIFEPFFTTKPQGKGIGMGLTTVYGIVKQHEGFIDAKSTLRKGTTFSVYLPRCKEDVAYEVKDARPEEPTSGEGELILLVEDEVDLLHIGRILLEKLGYRVIAATSPHEAIDVVKERGRELSLLITDMIMPGMSGIDLIKKVKECAPQVRFILSSGYGVGPLRGDKEMEFLEKPYTIETLAAKIKKVLGKV